MFARVVVGVALVVPMVAHGVATRRAAAYRGSARLYLGAAASTLPIAVFWLDQSSTGADVMWWLGGLYLSAAVVDAVQGWRLLTCSSAAHPPEDSPPGTAQRGDVVLRGP